MKKFGKIVVCIMAMSAIMSPCLRAGVGVKGGLNFANQSWSDNGSTFTPSGVQLPVFGVYFSLRLGKYLASQKGSKFTEEGYTDQITGSYIEVPVLAKIYVVPEGPVRPILFAGPAIGFMLSAEEVYDGESEDISDEVTGTDFGVVFGGGLEFKAGRAVLTLDVRYDMGLTDVEASDELQVKNKTVSVMIGLGF
jgi:hypothetical protein